MKKLTFLIICLFPMLLLAQNVTNIVAQQVGKNIQITYDLDKTATISVFLSTDGGKTYGAPLQQVSGDVGKNVTSGHKTVLWNVLAERENLKGDNIVFKVKADGGRYKECTVKGVTFKMVYVEGGTFTMGCTSEQGSDCYDDEKPAHQVTLSSYYMGETEVTQALWEAVMGSNPSRFKGADRPVEEVSWNDVQEFITRLNRLTGKTFRLPTEAEWEYAARGGNKSRGYKYAGSNNIGNVAWYDGNSPSTTHTVKGKQPNELGLYDMSGNVWEWCSDWYSSYSSYSQTNPKGSSSGTDRVFRGGSWCYYARCCRSADRRSNTPGYRYYSLGFRLSFQE